MSTYSDSIPDSVLFGNRFATQEVPSREFPEEGMIVFAVVALLNVFLVSRGSAGTTAGGSSQPAIIRVVLPILLLIVAVVALVWVVRVGDLGATAVWNPTAPPMIPF